MKKTNQKIEKKLNEIRKKFQFSYDNHRYEEAIIEAKKAIKLVPNLAQAYEDISVCFVHLGNWDEAIKNALKAINLGNKTFIAYDALSHAYGAKEAWKDVKQWGKKALEKRVEVFKNNQAIGHTLCDIATIPKPSQQTKDKNIISFSLFGNSSKYCETAILNVLYAKKYYPNWSCLFYIDNSVPNNIVSKLKQEGAMIEQMDNSSIPSTMWRFLAIDRDVHRVIFRDADSVLSERESGAVNEWVNSNYHFHHMRDIETHTELILAGLWGSVKSALPPMSDLIKIYLQSPLKSIRFADQFFLREFIWPYAKHSLLEHDSVFNFWKNSHPFPSGERPNDFHVGFAESSSYFTATCHKPNGSKVTWELYEIANPINVICSYEATVNDNAFSANLPKSYTKEINKLLNIRVI